MANKTKKHGKRIIGFAAAAVILAGLLIGMGIYHTPANRLNRHMDMANKYLEEMAYEQALVEFDRVIEIDPMNVEAYLGKAQAYEGMNDMELAAAALEDGLERIPENGDIRQRLVELYLDMAEQKSGDGLYEEMLKLYDRLLELEPDNGSILADLGDCLRSYIEFLMAEGRYDEIRALADKYGKLGVDVDFASILEQIRELEERKVLTEGMFTDIAALCQREEYQAVFELMRSEEYAQMLGQLGEISGMYGIETDYGKVGLYPISLGFQGTDMIYYGGYEGDIRQGEVVWLGCSVMTNYLAEGRWEDDMPQGEFTETSWYVECDMVRSMSGELKDGVWDGIVTHRRVQGAETSTYQIPFAAGMVEIRMDTYGADDIAEISEPCLEAPERGRVAVDAWTVDHTWGIIGAADISFCV